MSEWRERLLQDVCSVVEPLAEVLAMVEGGSPAFRRDDEHSDADAHVIVADSTPAVTATFDAVEAMLNERWDVSRAWSAPEPTWHGHSQRLYQFRSLRPWQWLDLVVMRQGAPDLFTQPLQHGRQRVFFDTAGLTSPEPMDESAWADRLQGELGLMVQEFEFLQPIVEKQLVRKNGLTALQYYRGRTLAPLYRVLGMCYSPFRYEQGIHYLAPDLPPAMRREVEDLSYVSGLSDLAAKHVRAVRLFRDTAAAVKAEPAREPQR